MGSNRPEPSFPDRFSSGAPEEAFRLGFVTAKIFRTTTSQDHSSFLPSHRVVSGPVATYAAPDPALTSGPSLEPGLSVQVLQSRSDGWSEVLCSNGWSAWVDGRLLSPLRFSVPSTGLGAWTEPDPRSAPAATLDPGLDVEVLENHRDGWTRIVCTNGWSGWVDGRLLVPGIVAAAHSAPVSPPPGGPAPRPVGASPVLDPVRTVLPLGAAALVLVGALTPWFRVVGTGVTSWKLPLPFLILRNTTSDQPRLGPFLIGSAVLIAAYGLIPVLTGRSAPRWLLLVGAAVATNLAAFGLARWLHPQTGLGIGIGLLLVACGGVLAAVAHFGTRARGRSGAWSWL